MLQRAYSVLTLKSIDEEKRIIEGIATTPSVDRVGDVVEPKGVQFMLPMPFLYQHDAEQPLGHVIDAKVTKDGIWIRAQIAKGVSARIDEAWALIKAKLVRGLSIGFRAIDTEQVPNSWGVIYKIWEWLETSAVTIQANQDASISVIKSIDRASLAATGKTAATIVRLDPPPGVTGKSQPPKSRPKEGNEMKTIAEQIAALEAKRAANVARMEEVMQKSLDAGRSTEANEQEEFDTAEQENVAIDGDLKRLGALEKAKVATAKPVLRVETENDGSTTRTGSFKVVGPAIPKGVGFVRLLGARFMAREEGMAPADIALSKGWGDDLAAVLRTPKNVLKTAVTGANTTDSTWAGPLVTYNNLTSEFIELLRARSILARIPGLRKVPFNIKVPRETGEMTGYWVPQGSPKPLTAGAFDTVTLDFTKVAGITFQTQELLRFSQPNSETLLVNSLTKALTKLVDNDFLDPSKAAVTGESPASITNGTSAITASGQTVDAFRADFADLLAQYTASNYTLDDLVIVMSQTQALRLSLLRNDFSTKEFPDINKDGGFIEAVPVITSENIAANGGSPADGRIIVALAANSILLADDGGVEVDISTEASVQAESAPDSPATASTVMISFWQRNMVGIRCERYINWVKARSGAAAYISGANYG